MNETCNYNHECEGELFEDVERGYVCERAISEHSLCECRNCGRYGEDNVMDYFTDTDDYECKMRYGCNL